ncbi:hypothetical protein P9112_000900 [Eukaryota sp. TZLM1-RC]
MVRCAVLLLLTTFFIFSSAFTFRIEPTKRECFYEEISKNTPVSGSYQVSAHEQLQIDFEIIGPDQSAIVSTERKAEDAFFFQAPQDGIYQFCFRNQMTHKISKLITFTVKVGTEVTDEFAKQEHLTPIEESVVKMRELLEEVIQEQHYMKARERVHRSTTESTNHRVLWWSLFEIVALIAFSLGQILYLRKLIEAKPSV